VTRSMSGSTDVLALRNISCGYGEGLVIHDVSLSVREGTLVALIGPNGAGKTTVLGVASGLIRPRSGQVSLCEQDVTVLSPFHRARRGLCHIREGQAVFPSLTVSENLRVIAGSDAEFYERVWNLFPELTRRRSHAAGNLSGGEQKMLALAWGFLPHNRVVLVDEPSMGLAPKVVDKVFEVLEELVRRGVSVLLVEQYVSRALAIADYVYVIQRGEIRTSGAPHALAHDEMVEAYMGGGPGGEPRPVSEPSPTERL
jgi:branched-chain amino acid transport system ATP-binding protein